MTELIDEKSGKVEDTAKNTANQDSEMQNLSRALWSSNQMNQLQPSDVEQAARNGALNASDSQGNFQVIDKGSIKAHDTVGGADPKVGKEIESKKDNFNELNTDKSKGDAAKHLPPLSFNS